MTVAKIKISKRCLLHFVEYETAKQFAEVPVSDLRPRIDTSNEIFTQVKISGYSIMVVRAVWGSFKIS